MGGVSNLALQSEIKGLGDQIGDVKKLLVNNEERIRCLERAGDSTRPVYENRISSLEKTSEEHKKELADLAKLINTQAQSIENLKNSVKSMKAIWNWALGIFTAVVILVTGLLVTGQATLLFK